METVDLKATLQRQADIIPLDKLGKSITIIGAGAVGSWVALSLAKMGFLNLTVWDYDTVDVVNMNCQMYPIDEIGNPKVDALRLMVKKFTGRDIQVVNDKFTGQDLTSDIVISAVDCMEVRLAALNACQTTVSKFIDPRMGAEAAQLYVMHPIEEHGSYMKSWFPNDEGVEAPCTAKSTIYCANVLAGLVCKAVKNIACGEKYTRVLKYDMSTNHFENYEGGQ